MTSGPARGDAPDCDPVLVGRAQMISRLAGVTVAALGAAVLAGVLLGPSPAVAPRRGMALGFLLAGTALVLAVSPSPRAARAARGLILALLGLATGMLLTLADQLTPSGPASFLLAGITLLLTLDGNTARSRLAAQLFTMLIALIGIAVFMGHAYGVLATAIGRDAVARQTSMGFLILCAGLITIRPEHGPIALMVRRSLGGTVVRRLMVPTFFLLTCLRVTAQRGGWYETPVGLAGVVLASLVAVVDLMVRTSRYLDNTDRARQVALTELQTAHDELEARVEQRTEQLRASEAAMAVARDTALSASRAKSAFLAAMSHELRTPLNAVVGVSWLLNQTALTPEQRNHVQLIRSGGMQLLAVIDDVLDLSKIEAGKLTLAQEPFSPRAVVESATRLLAGRAAEKGLALAEVMAADLPESLVGDEGRLRQVLINLVGNAIKFTEAGRVEVLVRWESRTPESARLTFAVKDTGIGIPADKLSLVFERFTQADASTTRRYGGSGLGLAICRQLVEMMGGTIGLDSEEGVGSEFWFTLELPVPAQYVAPVTLTTGQAAVAAAVGAAPLALVVEDDLTNQFVSRKMLEMLGCDVEIAPAGLDALAAVAARRFDIIYMDCQMPGMDGYEVTRRIRALEGQPTPARVPIVGLTAYAMQDDRRKCLDAGMDDYLAKPVAWEQLQESLARWVGRAAAVAPEVPASREPAGTGALDPARLAFLNALAPAKREDLLRELVRLFSESATAYLEELRQAAAENDETALGRIRHKFKGSSLNIGATRLAALVAAYAAGTPFDALEHELAAVKTALARLSTPAPAGPSALPPPATVS